MGPTAEAAGGFGRPAVTTATTLGRAIAAWRAELEIAGCPEPDAEARLIAAHVTGLSLGQVPAHLQDILDGPAVASAASILSRRLRREPLPYILGETEFFGLRLRCDPRAMVPRPETELLVEAFLHWLRGYPDALVVDVGTGCGCIALAVAANCPSCRVLATDASGEALTLARQNAEALGLAGRVAFLWGDMLTPVHEAGLAGAVRAVVANLPYLSDDEYASAPPELHFEPRGALAAGPTGLEAFSLLIASLPMLPALEFLALEIGATQGLAVSAMLANALPGWTVEVRQDYSGFDRLVLATRSEKCSGTEE